MTDIVVPLAGVRAESQRAKGPVECDQPRNIGRAMRHLLPQIKRQLGAEDIHCVAPAAESSYSVDERHDVGRRHVFRVADGNCVVCRGVRGERERIALINLASCLVFYRGAQ